MTENNNHQPLDECWQAFINCYPDYTDLEYPTADTAEDARYAWVIWQAAYSARSQANNAAENKETDIHALLRAFVKDVEKTANEVLEQNHCYGRLDIPEEQFDYWFKFLPSSLADIENKNKLLHELLMQLQPFNLVQGDSLSRLSPESKLKINSNQAWLVTNGRHSGHKTKKLLEELERVLQPLSQGDKGGM